MPSIVTETSESSYVTSVSLSMLAESGRTTYFNYCIAASEEANTLRR